MRDGMGRERTGALTPGGCLAGEIAGRAGDVGPWAGVRDGENPLGRGGAAADEESSTRGWRKQEGSGLAAEARAAAGEGEGGWSAI